MYPNISERTSKVLATSICVIFVLLIIGRVE
jgi:hypothetical protein